MNSVATLLYLPFFGAAVAMIGRRLVPQRYGAVVSATAIAPLAGMAAILAGVAPAVFRGEVTTHVLGRWVAPVAIVVRLDGLAWVSMAMVVVITGSAAVAAFSIREPKGETDSKSAGAAVPDRRQNGARPPGPSPSGPHTYGSHTYGPRFFFFLMTLVAGMGTVVLTMDVFTMFVGFEIIAIAAYVLIAYDRTSVGLVASFKYLLLSSVGILFFLIGVLIVYREFGTLSLIVISEMVTETTLDALSPSAARSIPAAVAALIVGIGVRTAFIPFHTWLPEAHAYAPHPISAILSGVLIKVSFFALIRIVIVFNATYLMPLFMWIGGITAVAAVVWALAQHDAKRLLAYHSISQMGYVLAAFGAASVISVPAALFHATNHALFKTLLFLAVGTVIHGAGERNLFRIVPVGRRAPLLAVLLIVGAVSISGVPPFNGFAGKQIVDTALHAPASDHLSTTTPSVGGFGAIAGTASRSAVGFLLSVAAIGTVASFLKLGRIAMPRRRSVGTTEGAIEGREHSETLQPPSLIVPATVLAALCLASGLAGRQIVAALSQIVAGTGSVPAEAAAAIPSSLFKTDKIVESVGTVVLGIAVFRVVVTRHGQRLAHSIQSLTPDIRGVLIMFVIGLGLFVGIALV